MKKFKTLVIFAHPYPARSIANQAIIKKIRESQLATINDLYENYPYFNIDVKREQKLLQDHDLIVVQHPFYWYNVPPLLKLWQDEVLESGFAFGPNGHHLKGKSYLVSLTAGGGPEAYMEGGSNQHPVLDFLLPAQQLSQLCHMNWVTPHVVLSSRKLSFTELDQKATELTQKIEIFNRTGRL